MRKRASVPNEIAELLESYRLANPINPRTGSPWGSSVELLYFSFASVYNKGLDRSLLNSITELPPARGDFKAPQGRPRKLPSKREVAEVQVPEDCSDIPEDILSLLKEYRTLNPLNPRTGEAWGTIAEVLRFAICSIEPLAKLDTSLIKSLYRLPTVQGDFRGTLGRRRRG